MGLKVYRARTMSEALAEVKRDLGKDAVILHTKSFRSGSILGLGGKPIVEVTASNDPELVGAAPRRKRREHRAPASAAPIAGAAGTASLALAARAYAGERTSEPTTRPAAEARIDATDPEPVAEPEAPSRRARDILLGVADREPEPDDQPGRQTAEPADQAHRFESDLREIKRMVGRVLASPSRGAGFGGGSVAGAGDALFDEYLKLTENSVATEIADDIAGRVRDELTPAELDDSRVVHQCVLRHLAQLVSVDADAAAPKTSGAHGPRVVALIGPTGVGKTTTVAKLAATYKLRHGVDVGLVTSDTYRIAAVEQLRTYAEIIGLGLKVVTTPSEMGGAVRALADKDVVLIDTAGRSPRDAGRLDELQALLDAARPDETHLVLSGASSEAVLMQAAERFGQLAPNRVLFTKLDEAVNFGVLVGVASRVRLKLSYVTTGQEVPDHIEPGSAERLARMVLEGAGACV